MCRAGRRAGQRRFDPRLTVLSRVRLAGFPTRASLRALPTAPALPGPPGRLGPEQHATTTTGFGSPGVGVGRAWVAPGRAGAFARWIPPEVVGTRAAWPPRHAGVGLSVPGGPRRAHRDRAGAARAPALPSRPGLHGGRQRVPTSTSPVVCRPSPFRADTTPRSRRGDSWPAAIRGHGIAVTVRYTRGAHWYPGHATGLETQRKMARYAYFTEAPGTRRPVFARRQVAIGSNFEPGADQRHALLGYPPPQDRGRQESVARLILDINRGHAGRNPPGSLLVPHADLSCLRRHSQ